MVGPGSSSGDWATETTLKRLVELSGQSRDILDDMLRGRNASMRNLNREVADTTRSLSTLDRGVKQATDNLRRSLFNDRQVWDRWARNISEPDRALRSLGQGATGLLDKVTGVASRIPVLGVAAGAVGAGLSMVVSRLFETTDAFGEMIQSGLYFGGSLAQFNASVAEAGLSIQGFTAISRQFGTALVQFGERRFLDATRQLRSTFADFAINLQEGNEWFAEYLDNSRLSGSLYLMSMEEQRQAFRKNLETQMALANITGVSVRQQREQQRRLRESLEYQLLLRSVSPERRQYLQRQEAAIMPVAGEEFAREFMTFVETRAPVAEGFVAVGQMLGIGDRLEELAAAARRGEDLDPAALQQAVAQIPAEAFQTALLSLRGKSRFVAERLMALRLPAEARLRAPGAPEPTAVPGVPPIDEASRAVVSLSQSVSVAVGTFQASLMRLFDSQVLQNISGLLGNITRGLESVMSAPPGQAGAQLQTMMRNLGVPGWIMDMMNMSLTGWMTTLAGVAVVAIGANAVATAAISAIISTITAGTGGVAARAGAAAAQAAASGAGAVATGAAAAGAAPLAAAATGLGAAGILFYSAIQGLLDPRREEWIRRSTERTFTFPQAPGEPSLAGARMRERGAGGDNIWAQASANIDRIETELEQQRTLNAEQQAELRTAITNLQGLQRVLEERNRTGAEQELLQTLIQTIRDGNGRLERAIQQGP